MTFGPDGALYVSNFGFGAPPIGLGQILRVDFGDATTITVRTLHAATASLTSGSGAASSIPPSGTRLDLAEAADRLIQTNSIGGLPPTIHGAAPMALEAHKSSQPAGETTVVAHSAAVDLFFIRHALKKPSQNTTNLGELEM
jgi:hypothetical protein